MTYEEAVNLKSNIYGNITIENNIPHYVIIVPKNPKDKNTFLKLLKDDFQLYNDSLCKKYSSDGKYMLYAIITEEGKEYYL